MQTELTINPAVVGKFRKLLNFLEKNPKPNVQVRLISELENKFVIEYEKPRDLFNLGRCFEPYKPPTESGSFTKQFDNSHISKI